MGITILSPYSGEPVKIRDQDIGRAVQDRDGKVFYVLQRSSGEGYYAAITRAGGEKDELRYDQLEEREGAAKDFAKEQQTQVHDARGPGRKSSKRGKLVILILIIIVAAAAYVAYKYKDKWQAGPPQNPIPLGQANNPHDGLGSYDTTASSSLACRLSHDAATEVVQIMQWNLHAIS